MEWTGDAVILGVRKHGETSVVAELMTRKYGRHLGLVHGGRSRTMRPVLQPGNSITATWRARLEGHLGQLRVEPLALRAARLMETAHGIYALQTMVSHLRLLAEREVHAGLYDGFLVVLDNLEDPAIAAELLIKFELAMLDELGFGLDLEACAATGVVANLTYVSPRTGRAVSADAGMPWADKLLRLPSFLLKTDIPRASTADWDDIAAGLALTGYFLNRNVMEPRGMKMAAERDSFVRAVQRLLGACAVNGNLEGKL